MIGGAEGTGVDGVRDAAFRRRGGAKAAIAEHPERIVGRASLAVQWPRRLEMWGGRACVGDEGEDRGMGGDGEVVDASEGLGGVTGLTGYAVSLFSSPHPSALDLSPRYPR